MLLVFLKTLTLIINCKYTLSKIIKIAIVDDHQIVIDGLKLLLKDKKNFEIVLENTNGLKMLEDIKTVEVDVLLTDVMMPVIDGYELSLLVRESNPTIKIVALSMNSDGVFVDKMIAKASINGYLLKTINKDELIQAIESIAAGMDYFSEDIVKELHQFEKLKKENLQIHLTAREIEIIQCIAQNFTNKDIATKLFISERTVETHRKNIFRKTNTHTAISLLEFVKKQKIIQ